MDTKNSSYHSPATVQESRWGFARVLRDCPVCREEQSHVLFHDHNRREGLPFEGTYVRCLHCGMCYLNPVPDAASLAQLYSDGSVDPVSIDPVAVQPVPRTLPPVGHVRFIARSLNGLLRGHPHDWPDEAGEGRNILDFGCFDGSKLVYWYQRGWQVAGIDVNRQAIAVARQRFLDGQFWCGDLLTLDISERFDSIRADNVVEHLLEPVPYLAALAKLLKPGGQLRIFVPNGAALSARLFGRYSYVYWMPFHVSLFTPETLPLAMKRAGFLDVQCFTFTPIGSWTSTQRQILLRPGFNRRPPSGLDRALQRISLFNYPGETIAQWLGMGEEVIGVGRYA